MSTVVGKKILGSMYEMLFNNESLDVEKSELLSLSVTKYRINKGGRIF